MASNPIWRNYLVAFCIVLILLGTTVSCGNNDIKEPKSSKIWMEQADGTIRTNDLLRIQKEIPFSLILPDYVPKELNVSENPSIEYSQDTVTLIYGSTTAKKRIFIVETKISGSSPIRFQANPNMNPEYLDFNNISVLETYQKAIPGRDYSTYIYSWIINDLEIHAEIDDYSQEESRDIIESMIK